MSNSQLNNLKLEMKNDTEVPFNLSSNVTGNSNDKTYFPQKLLLSNTQVLIVCKAFASNSSANIKLWKTQLHKIGHSGGFLGTFRSITKNCITLNEKCTKNIS